MATSTLFRKTFAGLRPFRSQGSRTGAYSTRSPLSERPCNQTSTLPSLGTKFHFIRNAVTASSSGTVGNSAMQQATTSEPVVSVGWLHANLRESKLKVKGGDSKYISPPVVWSPALSTRTVVFKSEYSKLNYASTCSLGHGSPSNHASNCFFGRSLSTSVATDLKPVGEVFKCQHETRGRLCKTLEKRNILDHKRRLLVCKYELRRKLYKAICRDPDLPSDIREKQRCKLGRLPRNSSFVRVRNRCIITGRSRAVLKMFRMSRIVFREKASQGSLMGVKKSSW